MSLKAKLEAVIYAAEEPVTLAQLAALFAAEAFEWKEEQSLRNERVAGASSSGEVESLSFISGEPDDPGAETAAPEEPAPASPQEAGKEATANIAPEAGPHAMPAADAAPPVEAQANIEQEARRLARRRDREVRAILRQMIEELMADYDSDGRGVDSSGVFGSLIARKLIATAGRKQVIGRPILYKTTREFLLRFGLKDVAELPSMEEFEKLAAIELEEPDAASNEEPAASNNLEFSPEQDENAGDQPEVDAPADESEAPAPSQTAETAASDEVPPSEEAAPAAPQSPEQVETENSPHGEEVKEEQ